MSCASTSLGPKSGLCLKTTSFVTPTRSILSPLARVLPNAYRAQQAARLHSLDPQLEALTARLLSPPNPALGALSPPPASTRSHGRQKRESAPRTRGACWGVGPRVLGVRARPQPAWSTPWAERPWVGTHHVGPQSRPAAPPSCCHAVS